MFTFRSALRSPWNFPLSEYRAREGAIRRTTPRRNSPNTSSLLDQRAGAVLERTKRLVAWDHRAELVVIPLAFRFRRLLDFVHVHVVNHAAVLADATVLGEEIVDRHFTHLGHYGFRVVGPCRLDSLQIMHGG